jgi:hypothetical protein
MYIQVESPRIIIDEAPNKDNPELHWYFVRQPLLVYKHGESYPDKSKLMLTITASKAEAEKVEPFKSGFYVLDDEAFQQISSGKGREPELTCNFTKLRLMNDKDFEFFGLSEKSKVAHDPLKKFSPNATA